MSSGGVSGRRIAFVASVRPAATASSRNACTASSESSAPVLVPIAGSFLQDVGRRRDDMATHLIGLDDIEDLARRGPDDLDIRRLARRAMASRMIGR